MAGQPCSFVSPYVIIASIPSSDTALRLVPAARVTIARDSNMAARSIRVAAAQITSINELAANFATGRLPTR
ncbi:hypothetical protein C1H46_009517 [Malus baccata]|uniref:Uncharacterized protein n=1 Tax=Malus baccata TaxID=106549 RepID=A0A540N1M4_MALBA|nr:hypothetical protein C1H46_009517 [Malus baccata]